MKARRTNAALFTTGICVAGCFALTVHNSPAPDLPLINRLDELVQLRLEDPATPSLGMGRMAVPLSFGKHYIPMTTTHNRDFNPENTAERKAIADLEERKTQVGLYPAQLAGLCAP